MSNYHNVSAAFLVGLALGSSAIAETAGQSPAPAQFEEPSYSQTCEEESENQAMIYGCWAIRRSTALEQRYQRVWQVLDAWQSDRIVEAFEESQSAWLLAMYYYCDAVTIPKMLASPNIRKSVQTPWMLSTQRQPIMISHSGWGDEILVSNVALVCLV